MLRFPEYSGQSLRMTTIEEVATIRKGKGISKSDIEPKGRTECIRYGELYTDYHEVISKIISKTNLDPNTLIFSEGNEVIIPASGESAFDIATASCVLKKGVALGGDLNIIKTDHNGVYLAFYLNNKRKKEIASLAQGISVVHLYGHQLNTLQLNLPSIPEQQKIAGFLTAVDQRIELLQAKKEKLEAYKKGVMQQIFSQKLRFNADDGSDFPDWEERKLGEIIKLQSGFAFKSENFDETGIPVIRISNISNHNDFIDTLNLVFHAEIKKDDNFRVRKGDLLIAMSGATTGKASIYDLDQEGYLNQRVGLFRKTTNEIHYKYLIQFVFSALFGRLLQSLLVAGAQPNISSSEIEGIKIPFPRKAEQQKIASFLTSLDSSIETLEKQINQTQTWKKGLLQKMFV